MSRPRDTQRHKLYAAEKSIGGWDKRLRDLDSIQAYLLRLTGSAWFMRRWPRLGAVRLHGPPRLRFQIESAKRGAYISRAFPGRPPLLRFAGVAEGFVDEMLVLHELAHLLIPCSEAAHGRAYAKIYLELVRHMNAQAGRDLAAAYKTFGVEKD